MRHTGAECHFVVGSFMLVALVVSTLGRSELAVVDTGVFVQRNPIRGQLKTDLVISQAKVTCQYSVEHVAMQHWCKGKRHLVEKLPLECCS
ncbi:hypothetical protein TNCV_106891 [Trichonephila clavipes]|nr:hypothetical protein TNCV_106891 [Trichonephila clavipes]